MLPAMESNALENAEESAGVTALSFEDALRELETIVRKLESGDAPLEESIMLYTRGEALRTQCTRRLADAEAKIQRLTNDPAGTVTGAQPFDAS
jgi:exodeoxyribonuclease VII small subunit